MQPGAHRNGSHQHPRPKGAKGRSQEHDENCSREEDLLAEAIVVKGHRQCQETLPGTEGTRGRHTFIHFPPAFHSLAHANRWSNPTDVQGTREPGRGCHPSTHSTGSFHWILPTGIKHASHGSSALQVDSLPAEPSGKPIKIIF